MSLRLTLFNTAARVFVRPKVIRSTPLDLRAELERLGPRALYLPPYTRVAETALAPGLRAAVISRHPGSRPPHPDRTLLWLHGGAFMGGSPRTHARLIARIAGRARLEAYAPDYRLAPEHPFPAAAQDARTAFDALVARGHAPGDILIGGDSAGGNLALGLLAGLLGDGIRPAGVVALSPVTDLTFSSTSVAENRDHDPLLPASRTDEVRRAYLAGADPTDPRASPLFADFPDPPPVFLQVGAREILRDDSRRMAERLRAAGGAVTLDEWPDAPHVFTMFDAYLPEAREGLRRIGRFIDGLWEGRD